MRGRRRASRARAPRSPTARRPARSRARAKESAARSSSNMSYEGTEETPSVPRPTRRPAARSSASGAMPQPSRAFERGQCATATSWRGEQGDLLVVDLDAVRGGDALVEQARRREAADPALAVPARPAAPPAAAKGPRPASSQSSSSWLSLKCVATAGRAPGRPRRPRASRCTGACGETPTRTRSERAAATYARLSSNCAIAVGRRRGRRPRGRRSRAGRARRRRARPLR